MPPKTPSKIKPVLWIAGITLFILTVCCGSIYEESKVVEDPTTAIESQNVEELTAKHNRYLSDHPNLYNTALFVGKYWGIVPLLYLSFLIVCWLIGNALFEFQDAEPNQPIYTHQALSMRVNYNPEAISHNTKQAEKQTKGCALIIVAIAVVIGTVYLIYKLATQ